MSHLPADFFYLDDPHLAFFNQNIAEQPRLFASAFEREAIRRLNFMHCYGAPENAISLRQDFLSPRQADDDGELGSR